MITISFILLLRKIQSNITWQRRFFNLLNVKDITDPDYAHARRVCMDFEIKNLGGYHDLYVQSDTLLLSDVFVNFRNMCFEIYELDSANVLPAPG